MAMAAALLRSAGTRRVAAGRATLQPAPAAGSQRAQASRFGSVSSYFTNLEKKRQMIMNFEYIKARELRILKNLEYKKPSSTPAYIQSPPEPASARALVFGGITVLGGIGWYASGGTEGEQKV